MKITVFGSSGFIGKNLVKSLQQHNEVNEVFLRNPAWENDIDAQTEVFINLIGKAHDHKGIATEKDYYIANYEIAKDVFNAFIKSNAEILIHISSIAAVEELERKNIITEESTCFPQSFYGKSKREAEVFLLNQSLPAGKKIVILRPTMIHGEGDKGNLTLLYKIISNGIPYPLGAFDNSRTFASLDNVVYVIDEIIKQKHTISSGVYNICDDDPLSTRRIIEIIGMVKEKNPSIWLVPKSLVQLLAKLGDKISLPINSKRLAKMTTNLLVSNSKIKKELHLSKLPLTSEEGMRKTVKSFF